MGWHGLILIFLVVFVVSCLIYGLINMSFKPAKYRIEKMSPIYNQFMVHYWMSDNKSNYHLTLRGYFKVLESGTIYTWMDCNPVVDKLFNSLLVPGCKIRKIRLDVLGWKIEIKSISEVYSKIIETIKARR